MAIDPFGKLADAMVRVEQLKAEKAQGDLARRLTEMQISQAQRPAEFRSALQEAGGLTPGLLTKFPVLGPQYGQAVKGLQPTRQIPVIKKELVDGVLTNVAYDPYTLQKVGVLGPTEAGGVSVTIEGDKGQPAGYTKKFWEGVGTNEATRLKEINELAATAETQLPDIDIQRQMLETGLETGKLEPAKQFVSSVLDAFGVDATKINLPDPATGQIFDVPSIRQTLNELRKNKGPQTDFDFKTAVKTFADLGKTPEANMFMIEYLDEMGQRAQMKADFIRDAATTKYADAKMPVSRAESDWNKWMRQHPATLVVGDGESKIPVTYSAYRRKAIGGGWDENKINSEWKKLAKKYRGK